MKSSWKSFKVYPGSLNAYSNERRLYFRVMIFPTREMQAAAYRHFLPSVKDPENAVAAVITTRAKRRSRYKNQIGYVLYNEGELTAEPVCHEAGHMAMHYLKRLRYSRDFTKDDHKREERFCYTLGRIAAQVQSGIFKAGL